MQIDPKEVDPKDVYFTMIGCITPRPIAWVSTISETGISNLAPFSYFSGVTSKPPTLLFCPGLKPDGSKKDTHTNIEATKEFVINAVPYALAEKMNATSAGFEHGVSEFEACGIEAETSQRIQPPRVKAAPVKFECKLYDIISVGLGNIVIGEIQLIDISDDALGGDGKGYGPKPDAASLDLIGRMGGLSYARTNDRFDLPRPAKP